MPLGKKGIQPELREVVCPPGLLEEEEKEGEGIEDGEGEEEVHGPRLLRFLLVS